MTFQYTPYPADVIEQRWQRALGFLPAATSWFVLVLLSVSSLGFPTLGASLLIAFLLFYVFRVIHNMIFLLLSFVRVLAEEESDWTGRLRDIARGRPATRRSRGSTARRASPRGLRGSLAARLHAQVLASCAERQRDIPDPRSIVHLIIMPLATEGPEVYEPGILALAESSFDARSQLIVALSVEGRYAPRAVAQARAVRRRHEHRFRDLRVVVHPPGLPGEVPGKGSNVGYAARLMTRELQRKGIQPSDVLLTCIDADTLVSPQYFSCLTYYFLAEPDRLHSCFQPLPVFRNNIWQTNSLVRVIEMSQTMFQLIDSTNVDTLVTFSCYSYSLAAIAGAGFWPPDVIGEDAAIYWKTFLHYRGEFKTVPLPVTVSMDAPQATTIWTTLRSAYKQKLRWAYGVENLVIVFRGLFRHRLVRGRRRWTTVLKFLDNGLAQATWPFILSLLIWLPRAYELLAQRNPLPVFNLGRISGVIFQLSGLFLALIVLVTGFFIYRNSRGVPLWKKVFYPLEWIIVLPVATVLLGGAPALHAQTKIAFGKPLVYVPMEKPRDAASRSPDGPKGGSHPA